MHIRIQFKKKHQLPNWALYHSYEFVPNKQSCFHHLFPNSILKMQMIIMMNILPCFDNISIPIFYSIILIEC
jgi:hypothetical protein